MKFARVFTGAAVEIFDELPEFHPDLMATIHEAPDDVAIGWFFDGENFSPPPVFVDWESALDPSADSVGMSGTIKQLVEEGF